MEGAKQVWCLTIRDGDGMVCRKFVFDGRFFLPDSNGDESVCPTTFPPIEQGTGRSSSFLSTPAFSPNPDKRLHANPLTSQPATHHFPIMEAIQ